MISRLTLSALVFAAIGTASLAIAAHARQSSIGLQHAAKTVRIVQLPDVVVVAKRLPQAAR